MGHSVYLVFNPWPFFGFFVGVWLLKFMCISPTAPRNESEHPRHLHILATVWFCPLSLFCVLLLRDRNTLCFPIFQFTPSLSIYFYSCCSHLEHTASMELFITLQFLNLSQSVGPLGRGSAHSRATTYTGQHKHWIRQKNKHALRGFRTYDPNIRANDDISCHRPRGQCARLSCHNCHNLSRLWTDICNSSSEFNVVVWTLANGNVFSSRWTDFLPFHLLHILTALTFIYVCWS
jgi:hypothetical protein